MILVIDNFDSFAFNLVQFLGTLGAKVEVHRNNQVTADRVEVLNPEGIVISPGPCTPREAGVSKEVIERLAGRIPILGVCLGHQCIAEAFGGRVVRAPVLMHGKASLIHHGGSDGRAGHAGFSERAGYAGQSGYTGDAQRKGGPSGHAGAGWLRGLPTPFLATRYHSLAVERESLPETLEVTAWTEDGQIMGIRHREWPVEGVQFHPESILSDGGATLLSAFLVDCGEVSAVPAPHVIKEIEEALKGVVAQ